MKIDIINLNAEINGYICLIENYEESVLNIYNCFSNIQRSYQSEKSSLFFDDIYTEKKNLYEIINELKDIKKIYKYLISKYEKFGNKIEIMLDNKNKILNSCNKYLSILDSVLNKFNNLSLSNDISEKEQILSQKNKIINLIEKVKKLKLNLNKDFDRIQEIEKEVKVKINNLSIKSFKEKDIYKYQLGSKANNIMFDIEKMQIEINKLDLYFKEESIFFDDFYNKLNKINKYYVSNNKKLIDTKKVELRKVFNFINNEHKKDEKLLNDEVSFFKSLPSYLSDNLNNIGGGNVG